MAFQSEVVDGQQQMYFLPQFPVGNARYLWEIAVEMTPGSVQTLIVVVSFSVQELVSCAPVG